MPLKRLNSNNRKHTPPVFNVFMQSTLVVLGLSSVTSLSAAELFKGDVSGNISIEGHYFGSAGAFANQQKHGGISISVEPKYRYKLDDYKQINFAPFFRWDEKDKERTHADIRQFDYTASMSYWDLQAGVSKVYWGVAESQHLVDIINQTDAVEGSDGEDKLGQPMIRLSRITDNGAIDFFVLPYFRERTYPGENGRLRSGLVVDSDITTYESGSDKKHVDYALRWTETMDDFDVGLHYFDGTSRDPVLSLATPTTLRAHYPLIKQVGLDLQYTGESTIWKFEAINRNFDANVHRDYTAFVGGFEHSLPALDSGATLSLLGEFHHDSRGYRPTVVFQKDLFLGARYTFNDANSSEILAGTFIDLDDQSKVFSVEASRRVGKGLKLNLEARLYSDIDASNPLNSFERDSFIKIELQKYF